MRLRKTAGWLAGFLPLRRLPERQSLFCLWPVWYFCAIWNRSSHLPTNLRMVPMHRIGQSPEKGREEEQELTCGIPVRKYQSLLFTPTWLGRVGTTVRQRGASEAAFKEGLSGAGALAWLWRCLLNCCTVLPCPSPDPVWCKVFWTYSWKLLTGKWRTLKFKKWADKGNP